MSESNVAPLPRAPRGPRFTFTVPEKSRLFETDPRSITIVPLTAGQNKQGNLLVEKSKDPYDKVKLAVAAFDGRPLDWGSGEVDSAVDALSPPVRDLLLVGFVKVNSAAPEDADGFLASMEVAV